MAARMVSCHETAEDLVQEALLDAWLSIASLRSDAAFDSWLFGIVLNHCRSHIRRRRSEISLDSLRGGRPASEEELSDPGPTADEILEEQELKLLVRNSLRKLPPRSQRAATLFYLEGLSLRQTAALMRVSVGTIKAQLHTARQKVRDALVADILGESPAKERLFMTEVTIWDVHEGSEDAHVVMLLDPDTDRLLPITIAMPRAARWSWASRTSRFHVPLPTS